jgi:YD repeat-containing protein
MIQQIQDVDGAQLMLPSGWVTPSGGGLNLITDYDYDLLGRNIETLGPAHEVLGQTVRTASWTIYRDLEDETYSGQGYALGATGPYQYTLTNPVSIQRMSDNGLTQDSITAVRGCDGSGTCGCKSSCACALPEAGTVESAGKLSASDCFPQSSWVRWSTSFANKQGQMTASRTYHTIPASGAGSLGVNYGETIYGYDELNQQNRTVSPTGTINRTVYDVRGQVVSSWMGTNDNLATASDPTGGGATGNNMVQTSAMQYDGGSDGGDGNLTQQTAYVDGSTTRVTSFEYDFRNRRIVTDGEINLYQTTEYDNLSQTIRVDRRNTSSGGNLIARSETKFDNRGRVYQTIRYAVNPATGTVGNSLVDNTYYDASGNVIETRPSGSEAFTKTVYDGIGRGIESSIGYTESVSSSSSSGSALTDVILKETHTVYDAASNAIYVTTKQRFHNATGTGPLNGPSGAQPKSRDSYVAMWQDGVGRTVATANYGTNNNVGPPERPELPPESSELILVSQTGYNARGEAFESVDPAGKIDRTYADDAGRTVRTIQNYVAGEGCFCPGSEQNVTTEMRYGSGSQLLQLIAKNSDTGDQITQYVYGVTLDDSEIASNDLLRAEIYPDAQDSTDRVTYTYNRQGQRTSMTDQNGSVHEYAYDLLGRPTGDIVPTLGADVDGAVRRIGTTYEVRGMVEKITSYSDAAGTTPANEVQNVYNSFAQLVTQYQEHGGAVNTGTSPKVEYAYADGSNNTIRPTSMTYPNGRVLQYLYDDTAADKLSRIRTLKWDGTDVCQYSYLGLGTFVITDYLEPEVKLDYALGSGANPYTGFDQFGRIIDLLWEKYGASSSSSSSSSGGPGNALVHLLYGYDQASNRTYREDLVAQAYDKDFDELYEYDGMQRLKKFHRGRLSEDKQAIIDPALQQGWHLDATGNWQNFTQNDQEDASQTLDQQRIANQVNEITQIARTVGPNWATPAYDRNGNMIVIPQPKDMTQTFQGTWDAWNRLVKLKELDGIGGWQNLAEYQYDGQTWRIVTKNYDSGMLDETRHFYFTRGWQDIEERLGTTPSTADAQQQYVWGLRYIDELIRRNRDSDTVYVLQSIDWMSFCASNGTIILRFKRYQFGSFVE